MRTLLIALLVALSSFPTRAEDAPDPVKLYARVLATYAELKSYSDTGTVVSEYSSGGDGPPLVDKHTFITVYRAPREFKLDFRKSGGDRFVTWCEGQDFHTWWKATGVQEDYPKGRGANAFALGAFPTAGANSQIPPLLFSNAGLHGPLTDLAGLRYAGTEKIGERNYHKLAGEVGLAYGTGNVTSVRPTTVWIDAETLLIRRVVEDPPKGSGKIGTRTITSFEPRGNPELKESDFRFVP
jgi:hypothetical protein